MSHYSWVLEREEIPAAHDVENGTRSAAFFMRRGDGDARLRIGRKPERGKAGMYPNSATGGVTSRSPQRWSWLREHVRYRSGDVVVATYPKCGTTLTEQVVLLLLNGGDASALDPLSKNSANYHGKFGKIWPSACIRPNEEVAAHDGSGPEEFVPRSLSWFEARPSPRVIKTHAPVPDLLGGNGSSENESKLAAGAKYIVCTRNPLDACVSYYYHAWNPFKSGWPFGAWVEAWCMGDAHNGCGSWFSWHRGWFDLLKKEPSSILWVHYESFLANPISETLRIAAFLGVSVSPSLIEKVVEESSFSKMKEAATTAAAKGARGNTPAHLRKGNRGGWRTHFASVHGGAEEAARLKTLVEKKFKTLLAGSGLQYDLGDGQMLCASGACSSNNDNDDDADAAT